jgi:cystathionine beta-lyase/cystathionine gamma-synthase
MPLDAQIESGITDGMLRVSVGLESTVDIVADLQQALDL